MLNPFFMSAYKNMFKGFYYTVQDSDTLETISKRYKVSVNNIISANNLTYPYGVGEGEKIFIPGIDEPVSPEGAIYTMKFGDSIEEIAKRYNVSVQEILDANFVKDKRMLYVGQKVLIPSGKESEVSGEQASLQASDNKDEIKIYPLSSIMPKPGTREYEAVNTLGRKFSELRRGNKGKDVAMLQRMISALGYRIRRVDGVFGYDLESEIKKIQQKAGLEQNGVVDQRAWQYIFSLINKTSGSVSR